MVVDLHIHTNNSDGKLSVTDTIKIAAEHGINLLSITDHDSLGGVSKALHLARSHDITCISGLELSCRNENSEVPFPQDISVHILGYNIDYKDKAILSHLKKYHSRRKQVLTELIDELSESGFDAKYQDIYVIAGTQMRIQDVLNHINSSFMWKKKKDQLTEIANSYYGKLFALDTPLSDAIKLIKDAGGIPVLAHGFFSYRDYDIIKNTTTDLSALIDYLCELGIEGLEVYYSRFKQQQIDWMLNEAVKRNLIITAGSDFHGTPLRKNMINYEIGQLTDTINLLESVNRY